MVTDSVVGLGSWVFEHSAPGDCSGTTQGNSIDDLPVDLLGLVFVRFDFRTSSFRILSLLSFQSCSWGIREERASDLSSQFLTQIITVAWNSGSGSRRTPVDGSPYQMNLIIQPIISPLSQPYLETH